MLTVPQAMATISPAVSVRQHTHLNIILRTSCRVCGSHALTPVLSLGNHAISDFVNSHHQPPAAPLELVLCDVKSGGCGLLQLRHTADQNFLYRNYWYRSGMNQTMRTALSDITQSAERLLALQPGDVVVDTGSNDNTLLRSYQTPQLKRIGFEPARSLMSYADDHDITVFNDYFNAPTYWQLTHRPARVITSIAMFYDLEDPNQFTADVKSILAQDGLWIIQMMYLPTMLAHNIFDNICHEHLEYYSLLSLEALLQRHDLKVIDVELNDVNGGSYRAYITHRENEAITPLPGAADRLTALREQERTLKLEEATPYQAFADRVTTLKHQCVNFIRDEVTQGKTVYVYGASTKGNTLLQYYGLDNSVITAAAERNPDKWGKRTVATNIPIISEEEARAAKPDYFLILPWHFLKEFRQREAEYLNSGGKFIVPLPEFKIIGAKT